VADCTTLPLPVRCSKISEHLWRQGRCLLWNLRFLYKSVFLCSEQSLTKEESIGLTTESLALFKLEDSVRTAQWTHSASITQTSQLMLRGDIIAVCSEIRSIENTLSAQNTEILNVKPGGTRGYKVLISGTATMFWRQSPHSSVY